MAHDVFVSYSTKDKVVADAVVSNLENNNIRCWYAPRDIKPGEDWGQAISMAIDECKLFLIIFSGNANRSQRVLDEVNLAISQQVILLPFRIENLEPDGAMRLHLSSRHWLDAYNPSWDKYLNNLVESVASFLNNPIDVEKIKTTNIKKGKSKTLWIGAALAAALAGIYFFAFANKTPTSEIIDGQSQVPTSDLNNMLASSPELNENKICAVLENYETSFYGLATDALTWEAMQRAADDFGVEIQYLISLQESDYEANINSFINDNCELIVTSSWMMAESISKASAANPDQKFAAYEVDSLSQPNVLGSTTQSDQGSFLSGYLAAGMSQTGKVAVYSVIIVPGTQLFLDGFAMGVEYYNEVKGSNVELLGWDMETEQGFLVESFDNPELGRDAAKTLMNLGADVIMPAAGATGLGSLDYIAEQGRGLFIGVDMDLSEENPDLADYLLASVVKNIDVFVYDSIELLVNGNFGAEYEYPLNLENGGVSLVFGSSWAEKLPWEDVTFARLRNEIEELIPKIISGDIKTKTER